MFQDPLFEQSISAHISVQQDHPLVKLCETLDWTALIVIAVDIWSSKIKREAGKPPKFRQLIGALALMATRNLTYRDAEDQIAHYAPARYLCDFQGKEAKEKVAKKIYHVVEDIHQEIKSLLETGY